MNYGEQIVPRLLDELEHYCRKLDAAEKKLYGADTFKGREHIWVEKLPDEEDRKVFLYVVYYSGKKWRADYYDMLGHYVGHVENEQPFDFKTKKRDMIE